MGLIGNQVKTIVIFFNSNRILFDTFLTKTMILITGLTMKSTSKLKKTHQ